MSPQERSVSRWEIGTGVFAMLTVIAAVGFAVSNAWPWLGGVFVCMALTLGFVIGWMREMD